MHPLHWECSEKKLTQFWEPSNLSFVAFNLFTIFKVIYTEKYSAADVNFQKKNGNKKKTDKTCPLNIDTSMADIAVKPSSAAYTVSFLLGVDRYVFFRADTDTDYYRSSRPITDILNRYTCLV